MKQHYRIHLSPVSIKWRPVSQLCVFIQSHSEIWCLDAGVNRWVECYQVRGSTRCRQERGREVGSWAGPWTQVDEVEAKAQGPWRTVERCRDDGLVDLVRSKDGWSWGSRGSELKVRRWWSQWDARNQSFWVGAGTSNDTPECYCKSGWLSG